MGKKYTTHTISIGDHNLDAPVMVQINALIADGLHSEAGYLTEESGTTKLTDAEIAEMGYIKTYTDTDTNTQLSDAQIAEMGYIKTYTDTDTNTQLSQAQVGAYAVDEGFIKEYTDTNTQLTSAEIAAMGYLTEMPSHNHDDRHVREGGTSFSGVYPMVVRVSARNIYSDADITFTGSTSQLYVGGSIKSPIFYDSNDTDYYLNPAGTSNLNVINATGGTSTNWNTAHGWGNHADEGYLTSYTDTNTTYGNTDFVDLTSAQTVGGIKTFISDMVIKNGDPTLGFADTDANNDDFYIHVNSNNFYVLADRDDSGLNNGISGWDGSHPLQLESDTNKAYTFGNEIYHTGNLPSIPSGNSIIDWTANQGSTNIHSGNYTNTNTQLTPAQVLTSIKAVDGSGSGLDADTVDGSHANLSYGAGKQYDFTINGNADTFYPVVISGMSSPRMTRLTIFRSYSETAPSTWNTASHKGGLTLDMDVRFGGWGGYPNMMNVHNFGEVYSRICGGATWTAHTMKFVVWLRGGGASYHIDSPNQNLSIEVNDSTSASNYKTTNTWYSYDHSNAAYDVTVVAKNLTEADAGANALLTYMPIRSNGTQNKVISGVAGLGYISSTGSMRAPYFYDSNDTSYYLDPASSSNLFTVTAQHFYGNLTGNASTATLAATATTANLIKVHDYAGSTNMRILGSHQTGGSDHVYSAGSMYLNCDTGIINATGFVGYLSGNASTATTATNVAWSGVSSKPASWLDSNVLIQDKDPSDTAFPSGFYQKYQGNGPTGTWFNYINVRHSNAGNGHGYQAGMSYYDNNFWFRSYQGGTAPTFQTWEHALSNGSGHQTKTGILQSNASLRAPIFYDTNNTSYYVDAASTTQLNHLSVASTFKSRNFAAGSLGYQLENRDAGGATFRFDGDTFIFYGGGGVGNVFEMNQDGNSTGRTSLRAPIFYDSSNTGYYVNPASQSHMNTLTLAGNRIGFINTSFDAEIRVSDGNPNGTGAEFTFYGDTVAGHAQITAKVGNFTANSRAPIFYDSNNTGYYLNPASTSNLNVLTLAGTATASNFILSSDERKKTKIKDLTRNNINTNWKSFEMKNDEGEYRTGVIAQELEETHPEFVNTDAEGFKSVKYIDLLIAKIAELEARLEKLEK